MREQRAIDSIDILILKTLSIVCTMMGHILNERIVYRRDKRI